MGTISNRTVLVSVLVLVLVLVSVLVLVLVSVFVLFSTMRFFANSSQEFRETLVLVEKKSAISCSTL